MFFMKFRDRQISFELCHSDIVLPFIKHDLVTQRIGTDHCVVSGSGIDLLSQPHIKKERHLSQRLSKDRSDTV